MISDERIDMGSIDYAELEALLKANKTYIRRFSGLNDPADKLIGMLPALIAAAKERDDQIAAAEIRGLDEVRNPTEAMLDAARDWSYKKCGKPIGSDAATGCWQAMLDARIAELKAKTEPTGCK